MKLAEHDLKIQSWPQDTSNGVKVTHIPTGTVVTCNTDRQQFQNRNKAIDELKSLL